MKIYYDEWEAPIGPLLIMGTGDKIIRIDYGWKKDMEEEITLWASRFFDKPVFVLQAEKVRQAKEELMEYFSHQRQTFTMELVFYGTPFQKKVWQALYDTIPYGKTKSYKDIAETINQPKAVRAVGGAVNRNPFSVVVPCHRVIGKNGKLVGYNGGLDKKEFLLKHEGVETFH